MKRLIFLDGKFFKASHDVIKSLHPGIINAQGSFETLRIENSIPMNREGHFRRFHRGLRIFDIKNPFTDDMMWDNCLEVISQNNIHIGRIRFAVWKDKGVHCAIVACATKRISMSIYEKGYRCLLYKENRNRSYYSHLKTLRYKVFYKALSSAKRKGYDEAILCNRNNELVEGSTTNIFLVENNVIYTPAIVCGAINGLTRGIVLGLVRKHNLLVKVKRVIVYDLKSVDEIFLTNTIIGVMPVTQLDKNKIGDGSIGKVTRKVFDLYHNFSG